MAVEAKFYRIGEFNVDISKIMTFKFVKNWNPGGYLYFKFNTIFNLDDWMMIPIESKNDVAKLWYELDEEKAIKGLENENLVNIINSCDEIAKQERTPKKHYNNKYKNKIKQQKDNGKSE